MAERIAQGAILMERLVERMRETAEALRRAYRVGVDLTVEERVEIMRQFAALEAQGQILMFHLHRAMDGLVEHHASKGGERSAETAAGLMNALAAEAHRATSEWLAQEGERLEGAS